MVIGIFTFATMWAYDLTSLTVLRFVTGIGIGGMLPRVHVGRLMPSTRPSACGRP